MAGAQIIPQARKSANDETESLSGFALCRQKSLQTQGATSVWLRMQPNSPVPLASAGAILAVVNGDGRVLLWDVEQWILG
jgi:hypothetical protein